MSSNPSYHITAGFRRKEGWAIEKVWKLNQEMVNKLISQLVGHTPFNQDLAADVMEALITHHEPFLSLDGIRSFLKTVTRNKCISFQKKNQTKERHETGLIYHLRSFDTDDIEIAEALAYQQNLIRLLIARIPGKRGRIFSMYFLQNLSEDEIAQQLNISVKTVTNHIYEALRTLRMDRPYSRRRFAVPLIFII